MKSKSFSWTQLLVIALFSTMFSGLQAEPTNSEAKTTTLTQGQAAIVIARKMGLSLNATVAPTQAEAIRLLSARGIAPKGDWNVNSPMDAGVLARILVQALGLETDLTDAEIAGDNNDPFANLLIEKYRVDVEEIVAANGAGASNSGVKLAEVVDTFKGDPLNRGIVSTATQFYNITDKALSAIIAAIVGGSGGQVDSGSGNITPSAP